MPSKPMQQSAKRWQVYPAQPAIASKLADCLSCTPLVGQLMLNRNIRSLKDAQAFVSDAWTQWPLLPNQSEWMALLKSLISRQAPICVYGDYDVDGVTSTAMLVHALRGVGCPVDYISPHRFNDGYGLNMNRMKEIATKKYEALITVDCGISNVAEITQLKQWLPTISVLILDHHKCPATLPPADVIVNPQLADPDHPAYHLCSAGLVDYLFRTTPIDGIDPDQTVDLVAIGLVADVMPITHLNRWYVKQGLEHIHTQPRPVIHEFCIQAGVHHERATTQDIGFSIGPRMNAPGRLGDPRPVVECLLANDPNDIQKHVQAIESLNNKRRSIGEQIQCDIDQQIANNPRIVQENGIVVSGQFWHMGIIGINASRLVDKYHKPVVIIGFDHDTARGSARSVSGVNMYQLLEKCAQHLDHFGGHEQAGGFQLKPENIAPFTQAFIEHCASINTTDTVPRIAIDAPLDLPNVTLDTIQTLALLEPFGEQNPRPLFYTNATMLDAQKVGKTRQHVKFRFQQHQRVVDGIGFNMGDRLADIDTSNVWVAFHVSKNEFRGSVNPQLEVIDIKPYEPK